jgi:hypothetical protein
MNANVKNIWWLHKIKNLDIALKIYYKEKQFNKALESFLKMTYKK